MTVLGLLWNVMFRGWLPSFAKDLLSSFGGLFPVCAIYMMGVNMYVHHLRMWAFLRAV
jgi:hypothetical protein